MTTKTSPLLLKIKNEVVNEEIKEYAETAMNELLGWYGYENSEHRTDTMNKANEPIEIISFRSKESSTGVLNENSMQSSSSKSSMNGKSGKQLTGEEKGFINASSDKSGSPIIQSNSERKDTDDCGWCKRPVSDGSQEFLTTSEGVKYCTESCFTNSRRASFKRAKTCDWCKHVRRAVSYVDFQDGASQLQFCSDKCLNQYKMQIFCKETQAHLEMNPYLKEKGKSSKELLITPDLWLKNCRSRSASPTSDHSKSPSASPNLQKSEASVLPAATSIKPVISVTPVSKLLLHPQSSLPSSRIRYNRQHPFVDQSRYATKKLRSQRIYSGGGINKNKPVNSNFKVRNYLSNLSNGNHVSASSYKAHSAINNNNEQGIKNNIALPPTSSEPKSLSSHQTVPKPDFTRAKQINSTPTSNVLPQFDLFSSMSNLYPWGGGQLAQGLPRQSQPIIPPVVQPVVSAQTQNSAPQLLQSSLQHISTLLGIPNPPVALMIPYPMILPLPIPIPIPLPFSAFLKAAELKLKLDKTVKEKSTESTNEKGKATTLSNSHTFSTQINNDLSESFDEPLDFTKAKDTNKYSVQQKELSDDKESDDDGELMSEKLPKFKVTRLNSARLLNRDLESSRPLRKRKRIIDAEQK